jgi:hypothetical protein
MTAVNDFPPVLAKQASFLAVMRHLSVRSCRNNLGNSHLGTPQSNGVIPTFWNALYRVPSLTINHLQ